MNHSADDVNPSYQMSLTDPDAWEITLKVGVMNEERHWQAQIEVRHLGTDQLVFLESDPHLDETRVMYRLEARLAQFQKLLAEYITPF
uniref:Uncharacterized protein n=1 Tax=uncultured prokaryote TaxID=198431 RepID=A0A0H5Q7H4_9ZZZZ|nr:hypothetical protein [uncultured prokaryote]